MKTLKNYLTSTKLLLVALFALAGGVALSYGDDANEAAPPAEEEAETVLAHADLEPLVLEGADYLWVLLSAALVFFMQAGFKAFEVGLLREKHGTAIGMKNLIDYVAVALGFFLFGFGIMFGVSHSSGIIGTSLWGLEGVHESTYCFFLFQLGFAATAVTIVSGAMAERTGFLTYIIVSFLVGTVIYPIVGHWGWGNLYLTGNEGGWLANMGFIDFAGSTIVHSTGAWIALAGIWILGPRLGRYNEETGKLQEDGFTPYNKPYAILGVLVLWLGWWGFNGGSQLALDNAVGSIIMNTSLAAAAAGLAAFLHCSYFQGKEEIDEKLLGGTLGGLVAITACCANLTGIQSIFVGLMAGVVHNLSYDLIVKKLKLDDSVGAVPVHGFCGVLGTLAVCLNVDNPGEQFKIQLIGCAAVFAFAFSAGWIVLTICKSTIGLRVSPQEEMEGIDIGGRRKEAPAETVDADDLADLM